MMLTINIVRSRNNLWTNYSPTIQLSPGLGVGVTSGGRDDNYIYGGLMTCGNKKL